MTSKAHNLLTPNSQPIIVKRYCVVPYYGPTGIDSAMQLCAPKPLPLGEGSAPVLQAPPASASEARMAMFNMIGQSLLGDEFVGFYDEYSWVQ